MPKPRRLSGDDVVAILSSFGFYVHSQRGSHVKLRRIRQDGGKETLTIPRHKEWTPEPFGQFIVRPAVTSLNPACKSTSLPIEPNHRCPLWPYFVTAS